MFATVLAGTLESVKFLFDSDGMARKLYMIASILNASKDLTGSGCPSCRSRKRIILKPSHTKSQVMLRALIQYTQVLNPKAPNLPNTPEVIPNPEPQNPTSRKGVYSTTRLRSTYQLLRKECTRHSQQRPTSTISPA